MAKVKVSYLHHVGEHKPGDTASLDEDAARALVDAGVAKIVEDTSPASSPSSKKK